MTLFVKEVKKEGKLVALDVHGNECTLALLQLIIAPGRFNDSEDDIKPSEFARYFFRLDDEAKDYYGTKADYAISRELFNAAVDFIVGDWKKLVDTVSKLPATEQNISEISGMIDDKFSPQTLIRYLF